MKTDKETISKKTEVIIQILAIVMAVTSLLTFRSMGRNRISTAMGQLEMLIREEGIIARDLRLQMSSIKNSDTKQEMMEGEMDPRASTAVIIDQVRLKEDPKDATQVQAENQGRNRTTTEISSKKAMSQSADPKAIVTTTKVEAGIAAATLETGGTTGDISEDMSQLRKV